MRPGGNYVRLWGGGVLGGCGGVRLRQEGVRGVGVKSCGVVLGRKSYVFAGGKKFERKRMTG